MAKGYWMGMVDIHDPEAYKAYVKANAAVFRKYGGRFLVRGGPSETMEGKVRARLVVIEFKDYATALECYKSEDYQQVFLLRRDVSTGDMVVVEGYDGVQPSDG